jgi:hypothetical protein
VLLYGLSPQALYRLAVQNEPTELTGEQARAYINTL